MRYVLVVNEEDVADDILKVIDNIIKKSNGERKKLKRKR
jgi:hypothetical protein